MPIKLYMQSAHLSRNTIKRNMGKHFHEKQSIKYIISVYYYVLIHLSYLYLYECHLLYHHVLKRLTKKNHQN